ncbi:MAG TPA: VWA domain-containing protein [Anaerovoracaceae bacterium]|nr:VWA domain-containing protein [Anaerovoracaceae bacterium]
MENSLLNNLTKFIDVLRAAGVRVSLSESMDAIQALSYIDVLDRTQVKAALSACVAKSETERKIFSESFDRFFIDPVDKDNYISLKSKEREQKKQEILERASELQYQGERLEISQELKAVYAEITEEERKSILDYLERTSTGKNMKPKFKPITENVVKGKLNNLKNKYKKPHEHHPNVFNSISEAGLFAEDVTEAVRQENSLFYKDLSNIDDKDMPAVIQMIKVIAEKLRKHSRNRHQTTNKKAGLDFKRTIRSNMAAGGTLFKLKYKMKHGHKQRILTLCDVSASMYRFSGFVLKFITSLHFEITSADNYIFSQDIEHLNIRMFTTSMDIEQEIIKSRVWKKGTDIHRAIRYILKDRFVVLNSSTIVIIVSDAKTLNAGNTIESLRQLNTKVKKIYWLNPIHEAEWPGIAGIEGLKQYCTMMDCSTLEKLSKACERF